MNINEGTRGVACVKSRSLARYFLLRNAKMGVMEWDPGSPTKIGGWFHPQVI